MENDEHLMNPVFQNNYLQSDFKTFVHNVHNDIPSQVDALPHRILDDAKPASYADSVRKIGQIQKDVWKDQEDCPNFPLRPNKTARGSFGRRGRRDGMFH